MCYTKKRTTRKDFYMKIILRSLLLLLAAVTLFCSCVPPLSTDETTDTSDIAAVLPTPSEYGVVGIDESQLIGGVNCKNALLTRVTGLEAVAARGSGARMYPASMTKIMTFIAAYENAASLEDKTAITKEMKNKYADASRVGIDVGDILTTEQLLYALLLESDTDAAIALAEYVAGSEEDFVKLMNAKCEELGLADTHFVNVTGLHDPEHYSSAADMTSIFAYALENELFKKIITTESYVTYLEYFHEGQLKEYRMTFQNTTISPVKGRFAKNGVSLGFTGGSVIGGKTGYTDEAKYCLALLAEFEGEEYILITAGAATQWDSASDSLYICQNYLK